VPATQQPFKTLEPIMTQPKKTADKFRAIFDAIEDLRYGEMIQFCEGLSNAAVGTNLVRSKPHSWAAMMQDILDSPERQPNAS